jgi:hypothetical protein
VAAKARRLLEFAEQRAEQAADWVELHNALFGLGGKATELLTTESDRLPRSPARYSGYVAMLLEKMVPTPGWG